MLNTYSAEYKSLTAPQRAKVRKAIAQYEAERNPIMYEVNRLENEIRRQAYADLNISERVDQVRAVHNPRLAEIKAQISALNEEWQTIIDTMRKEEEEITVEPYKVVYADPKAQALRDVWGAINERHEAKMADLLASFKATEGVA